MESKERENEPVVLFIKHFNSGNSRKVENNNMYFNLSTEQQLNNKRRYLYINCINTVCVLKSYHTKQTESRKYYTQSTTLRSCRITMNENAFIEIPFVLLKSIANRYRIDDTDGCDPISLVYNPYIFIFTFIWLGKIDTVFFNYG